MRNIWAFLPIKKKKEKKKEKHLSFNYFYWKVELGSRAGALKQMLLDLLEDPHEIRRMCIMGKNCTLVKGNENMECSVPLEKQIAEGMLKSFLCLW